MMKALCAILVEFFNFSIASSASFGFPNILVSSFNVFREFKLTSQ